MSNQAIQIHQTGGPEVMRLEAVPAGEPGPGELRIRHTASGVNFIDIHHRTGRYPLPAYPAGIGMEGAGIVEAVGQGVSLFKAGDRIAYNGRAPGSYSQARVIPQDWAVALPDAVGDVQAAAMMLKGLTAQYLVRRTHRISPGETIVVHAAAGGVGLLLCQWAKNLGATVIGTVGSEQKAEMARTHGCDHVVVYTRERFEDKVREFTGGKGVNVVYDSVGKDTFDASLACLQPCGLLVSFGTASGPIPPFDLFHLNRLGSLFVTSASLFTFTEDPGMLRESAGELFSVVESGAVKVEVNRTLPLGEAAEAHRLLQGRQTTGSMVLLT